MAVHFNCKRMVEAKMKRQFACEVVMEADGRFGRAVIDAVERVVDIHETVWIGDDIEGACGQLRKKRMEGGNA